jgi:ATP-dependent Lon protease
LGIHVRLFRRYGLHIHAPVGDDHAAAGLAIVVALVSVYTGSAAPADVVITGGTTLTGLVLSVSALHERLEVARRAGFEKIIAPSVQQKEAAAWTNQDPDGRSIVFVDSVEDALKATLPRMMKHLAALKASL